MPKCDICDGKFRPSELKLDEFNNVTCMDCKRDHVVLTVDRSGISIRGEVKGAALDGKMSWHRAKQGAEVVEREIRSAGGTVLRVLRGGKGS